MCIVHFISWLLVALRYTRAKYVLWCLQKQQCDCFPIYLIAYNVPPIFLLIAWHFIRDHHLVYIDRKYVSYLLFVVKIFVCSLSVSKFETGYFCYIFLNSTWLDIALPKQLSDVHQAAWTPPLSLSKHFLNPFLLTLYLAFSWYAKYLADSFFTCDFWALRCL